MRKNGELFSKLGEGGGGSDLLTVVGAWWRKEEPGVPFIGGRRPEFLRNGAADGRRSNIALNCGMGSPSGSMRRLGAVRASWAAARCANDSRGAVPGGAGRACMGGRWRGSDGTGSGPFMALGW